MRSPPWVGILMARGLHPFDPAVSFIIIILINFICHKLLGGLKIKKTTSLSVVAKADYNKYRYIDI